MEKRGRIFKIILMGDGGVGKTSIRRRYFGEKFVENYNLTIGADFSIKNSYFNDTRYVLQIWDLAGQPRFKEVRESYYKGTSGILLIFDLTMPRSFENIPIWLKEFSDNCNVDIRDIPIVVIGNKVDLRGEPGVEIITMQEGIDYSNTLSEWSNYEVPYIETSALVNINIEQAFNKLLENLEKQLKKEIIN